MIRHPFWPDLRKKYLHTTDADLAQLIAKEPDRLYEYTPACFCLTEDCNKELLQFKDMYVEIFHIIKDYARMFTFWWIDLEKEEKYPEFLEALAHLSQQLLDDLKDHRIPEEYPYH